MQFKTISNIRMGKNNLFVNKSKKKTIVFGLFCLSLTPSIAQRGTVATGGDFSDFGGSIAYSIGQIVYTTYSTGSGSMAQGIQQPIEISVLLGIDDKTIGLSMQAYPNPTTDYLNLTVSSLENLALSYQLIDVTGKLLENKNITSTSETIEFKNLPKSSYFVKVLNNTSEVKIFKIIKN